MKAYPDFIFTLTFGPTRVEDRPDKEPGGAFTHLQKFSRAGFLLTWPFCFHIWFFWQKQGFTVHKNIDGTIDWIDWQAGTEQGIYLRTPGYRFDAQLGMKSTAGYAGLHWD